MPTRPVRSAIGVFFTHPTYVFPDPLPFRDIGRAGFVSVGGATLQEVLDATKARVTSTVGTRVEALEVRAVPPHPGPLGISALWRGGPLNPG